MEPTLPCTHCGAVLPLASLVSIDQEGEYAYACRGCALRLPAKREAGPQNVRTR